MYPVGYLDILEDPQVHIGRLHSPHYGIDSSVSPVSDILGFKSYDNFPVPSCLSSLLIILPNVPQHIPYQREGFFLLVTPLLLSYPAFLPASSTPNGPCTEVLLLFSLSLSSSITVASGLCSSHIPGQVVLHSLFYVDATHMIR